MARQTDNERNEKAVIKNLEHTVQEDLEQWFRGRYHDVLREEISTEIIKWFRTRYAVVTTIIGVLALFGVSQYYSQIVLLPMKNKTITLETELDKTIKKMETKIVSMNITIDQTETEALLLREKLGIMQVEAENQVNRGESGELLSNSVNDKIETDIMYLLASQNRV